MANLINNNFKIFKINTYRGDYWDITLNKDMQNYAQELDGVCMSNELIYFLDGTNINFNENNEVLGIEDFYWDGVSCTDGELMNVGYTGFDNGLMSFERDKVDNMKFIDLYQNSSYILKKTDKTLKLHFVSGCTKQNTYDYSCEDDGINLNGGFLQGFFKTTNCYQLLPSDFSNGDVLTLEFTLKPQNNININVNSLNYKYKNNSGIFFYIGTRAENKWDYLYTEGKEPDEDEKNIINSFLDMDIDMITSENCECIESECDFDYIEDDIKIDDYEFLTHDGSMELGKYEEYVDYTNPFLLYNRTKDGYTIKDKNEKNIRYVGLRNEFYKTDNNLFLLMNRTKTGKTVSTLEEYKSEFDEKYNIYADLHENALAFRIREDGAIGYRYLIKDVTCEKEYLIVEGYSKENIVKNDEFNDIIIKVFFVRNEMQFKFYVNNNLVFISKFLPKLNLKQLDDVYEKQETVPFNISVGGGTQGLINTILPNYMVNPYRVYPLEENFAGSFVGILKMFKIYFN